MVCLLRCVSTKALSAIPGLVENATRNLFVAFDGIKLSKETYEKQGWKLTERRPGA
jgi:hypothetical protein